MTPFCSGTPVASWPVCQRLVEEVDMRRIIICLLLSALFLPGMVFGSRPEFDLVIKNARIVDGTGNPWFKGDIAVRNGTIAAIGTIAVGRGVRSIDAGGRIAAPGFIDVHGHIENDIFRVPGAENYLRMGVTSVVTGNCGFSDQNLGDWFSRLEKTRTSINVASLVGHNAVRRAGMNGDFDRPPTTEEMDKMREIVRNAMKSGAVGFSTGLEYVPGIYAKTDEIVELARESGRFGGIYATHMRDEGIEVESAIEESLKVGELASCPVQISHFKISAKKRWGFSETTLAMVEKARRLGRQATIDQYAYTAGATFIDIIFPAWVFDGGEKKAIERLRDPETRSRIKRDMLAKAAAQGFEDVSFVQITSYRTDPSMNGKRLSEIAARDGDSSPEAQAELACRIRENGGAGIVVHKMSESDVERIMTRPFTMIAADAGPETIDSPGSTHPREFGNNARVLARYVRERRILTLEEAIRKMTSLPAQTFGLWDRGLIRQGMAADIVIFDPETVADTATFDDPKRYAAGFEFVFVNGIGVIDAGKATGARSGQILRNSGKFRALADYSSIWEMVAER